MRVPRRYPDQATLRHKLYYAPTDDPVKGLKAGDWIWLQEINAPAGYLLARPGDKAGCVTKDGRRMIGFHYGLFPAHRLAFIYMMGTCPIGTVYHIDVDKRNNAWSHLTTDRRRLFHSPTLPPCTGIGASASGSMAAAVSGVRVVTDRSRGRRGVLMRVDGCGISLTATAGTLRTIVVRDLDTPREATDLFREAANDLNGPRYVGVKVERRGCRVVVVLDESFSDTQHVGEALLEAASDFYDELSRAA